MELIQRPRRLRGGDAVRRLCRETRLSPDSLIYPIFVDETLSGKRPIASSTTAWTRCARRCPTAWPPG